MSGVNVGDRVSSGRAPPTPSPAGCARAAARCRAETDARRRVASRGRAARRSSSPSGTNGGARVLGVVHLKDVVKGGMRERFDRLRAMGIRTVMITGDNPLTAAAIAAEAGVDDFLAEATPEDKLALIRREQAGGRLVAMTGDGTNDAPALAQADVGVAMNTGTQAAREAGNMVDLDSNPTKLIEIVEIGKQLLMTRGSLTTFSIANDVAKYFAIIPAMFVATYPALGALNIMRLHSPQSAILSSVIFNALIIIALIPLALRGVTYRPAPARRDPAPQSARSTASGGLIVPFVGIKLIDVLLIAPRAGLSHANHVRTQLRPAIVLTLLLCVITGFVYPGVVTGLAQLLFPWQANGIARHGERPVGGQRAHRPAVHAAGVLPPAALRRRRGVRRHRLGRHQQGPDRPEARRHADRGSGRDARSRKTARCEGTIPSDMVTASASGLDPDI